MISPATERAGDAIFTVFLGLVLLGVSAVYLGFATALFLAIPGTPLLVAAVLGSMLGFVLVVAVIRAGK